MSVTISIPPSLRRLAGGRVMTEVDGRDVGHCLELLVDRFPELRTRLFGTDARLRDWIEVYVNQRSCHPEELARTVRDGDEIEIVEAIVGG